MKTLIIYDATGYIYVNITGSYRVPTGIPYLEVEIPEGKILKGVNTSVTPNVPIYEELPKTEVQQFQEQLLQTQALVANLQEQMLLNK